MKKVICINKKGSSDTDYIPLTIGKEYDAYLLFSFKTDAGTHTYYRIIDDTGDTYSYSPDFFITLEEYRDKKLEEIGIITEK